MVRFGVLQAITIANYSGWVAGARWRRNGDGGTTYLFSVHSPTPNENVRRGSYVAESVKIVAAVCEQVPATGRFVIGGDFNFQVARRAADIRTDPRRQGGTASPATIPKAWALDRVARCPSAARVAAKPALEWCSDHTVSLRRVLDTRVHQRSHGLQHHVFGRSNPRQRSQSSCLAVAGESSCRPRGGRCAEAPPRLKRRRVRRTLEASCSVVVYRSRFPEHGIRGSHRVGRTVWIARLASACTCEIWSKTET